MNPSEYKAAIGWHGARALSVTECKQDSDWLLASPHWAVWKKKKGNNWPCGFKASPVRWWKGIRRDGFKAAQRRTPIGPEAIWVKRESKGILQRGEIICWIFKIIEVSLSEKCAAAMRNRSEKLWKQVKRARKHNNARLEAAHECERRRGKKNLLAVDRPAEVRFNGENLHEARHHFKVWLREVCPGGLMWSKLKKKTNAICFCFWSNVWLDRDDSVTRCLQYFCSGV